MRTYYIKEDEGPENARELDQCTSDSDLERDAKLAAYYCYHFHEGGEYETSWPKTFVILEDNTEVAIYLIWMRMEPTFEAACLFKR